MILSEDQYSLKAVPTIISNPVFYVMAVECGNWDAAARACILMLRAGASPDVWGMRLCGVLRARRRTDDHRR